ncbi:MAG: fibronectin type III domain-containing protein [Chitinophagaceae bacterium]|nr:MAG: fibronectin type III domain-containing protein [Chitinophagaceae bacterium]
MFPRLLLPFFAVLLRATGAAADVPPAPAPASGLTLTARGASSLSFSWTPGGGAARIVVARLTSGLSTAQPQDGTDYEVPAAGIYGSAANDVTGPGNSVVYKGTGSSLTVSGLAAGTAYSFYIYECNGTGAGTEYSTGVALSNVSTLAAAPTGQVSSAALSFGGVQSGNGIRLDYAAAATVAGANGYLLLYKEGTGASLVASELPQDGTTYSAGMVLGEAVLAAVVTSSSQSSSVIAGLLPTRHYSFFWIPYAGSNAAGTNSFNRDGSIGSLYLPSFSGTAVAAGGEAAIISSLCNSIPVSTESDGTQAWRLLLSEGADDDTLPTLIRSLTLTASSSNQMDLAAAIGDVALFAGGEKLGGSVSISATQLQFTGIGSLRIPDNGSLMLSLRLSVKPNVNGGASTGANRDGDRFAFQLSFSNIGTAGEGLSSRFSAFAAISSAATGANVYTVEATRIRFVQEPPAQADPYRTLVPAPGVEAVDAGGNRDVDGFGPVTLLVTGVPVGGTMARTPSAGLATFSGLYFTGSGTATVSASGGGFSTGSYPVAVAAVDILGVYPFAATACSGAALGAAAVAERVAFSSFSSSGIACNNNASPAATVFSGAATWSAALDGARYVQFTATPTPGYVLHPAGLAFEIFRSAAGATQYAVRSSVDGYSADVAAGSIGTGISPVLVPLPAAFAAQAGPLTFRIYAWGGSSGDLRIDNVVLRGSTGFSAATGPYRTSTSGSSGDPSIWEYYNGRSWKPAGTLPLSAPKLTIGAGHSVQLSADLLAGNADTIEVLGVLDAGSRVLGGTRYLAVSGTLRTAHPSGIAGTLPAGVALFADGSTVQYTGSGQPVAAADYYHLDLGAASGPVFPAATIGIRGALLPGGLSAIPDATISFRGSTPQLVPALTYTALEIDNAAGATLSGPAGIGGPLHLLAGTLTLGAHGLSVGTVGGGSAASFVVTNGAGALTVTSVADSVLFPVGASAGTYSPLRLAQPEGIGWSVRVQAGFDGYPVPAGNPLPLLWDITPGGAPAAPAALTFFYPGALWSALPTVHVRHFSGGAWELLPHGTGLAVTAAGGWRSVQLDGQLSFSPFTLSAAAVSLPVTLLRFEGRLLVQGNELYWTTTREWGNRGFRVERSADGRSFTGVGFVPAAGPGGADHLNYRFTDRLQRPGRWYYRLVQEDLDGRRHTSPVIVIGAGAGNGPLLETVFPSPGRGAVSVRLRGGGGGPVLLRILDGSGRALRCRVLHAPAGGLLQEALDPGDLPAGAYLIEASRAGERSVLPLLRH